jgi:hypothetical protein
MGLGSEEVGDQCGHLNLAQVHAALAYYHPNRDQMEAELAEEEAEYDPLSPIGVKYGSPGQRPGEGEGRSGYP